MVLLCNWNTNVSVVYIICILRSTPTTQNMEMSSKSKYSLEKTGINKKNNNIT